MKKYIVHVKEVWDQPVEIMAESKEEAIQKIADGEGEMLEKELDYSHSLDINDWWVEEKMIKIKKNKLDFYKKEKDQK